MASNVEHLPLEKAKSPVWKYFGFPAQEGKFLEPDQKKSQTVHWEIEKYLCMSTCSDKNLLDWWKMYEKELSLLAKLAEKYLCIPATVVLSESAFSTAGHVVNAKQAQPENVNSLVFLAHNLQ